MGLEVEFSDKALNEFSEAMRTQLPFATAVALTKTAKQAESKVRADLPRHFILRNRFTINSIKSKPAEKKDWPSAYSVVGSISPYMVLQEEGGDKTAKAKAFAIPKGIRRNENSLVPRSKWPGQIIVGQGTIPMGGRNRGDRNGSKKKPTPFLLHEQGGIGVYVRLGKGRKLKRLYRLTRATLHVKPRHWLEQPVTEIVKANLHTNFEAALENAMRTRK